MKATGLLDEMTIRQALAVGAACLAKEEGLQRWDQDAVGGAVILAFQNAMLGMGQDAGEFLRAVPHEVVSFGAAEEDGAVHDERGNGDGCPFFECGGVAALSVSQDGEVVDEGGRDSF